MQSVTVGANQAGQRLDKFLHKCLPEAGTGFLYKMLRKKNITLNGKKAEGKEMLAVGDEIKFFFSEETYAKFSGGHLKNPAVAEHPGKEGGNTTDEYVRAFRMLTGISVLYEDEHIVILNKPVGILTQKADRKDLSLNEWLIGYLLDEGVLSETELRTFHPSVCNRLDRNTSGIVLCGKSLAGSQALSRIIKERTLEKYYHTICAGEIKQKESLQGYLYKDAKTNKVTVVKEPPKDKKEKYDPIKTAYHPLHQKAGYTLLEVELITGKTHQIRSHLSFIDHPIIGDGKYGNGKINKRFREKWGLQNQLLHAYRIVFPIESDGVLADLSGKEIVAPYPKLFEKLVQDMFMIKKG